MFGKILLAYAMFKSDDVIKKRVDPKYFGEAVENILPNIPSMVIPHTKRSINNSQGGDKGYILIPKE